MEINLFGKQECNFRRLNRSSFPKNPVAEFLAKLQSMGNQRAKFQRDQLTLKGCTSLKISTT